MPKATPGNWERFNKKVGEKSMKLLIVGPAAGVDKACALGEENFLGVEFIPLKYTTYTDAPSLVLQHRGKIDGVLFSGKSPYKLCEAKIGFDVPADYVSRHESTLFKSLLETNYLLKRNINKLSIDTYNMKMFKKVYGEIGLDYSKASIFFAPQEYLKPNYIDLVTEFHISNFKSGRVSACITGLIEAAAHLRKLDIPVVHAMPTEDTIIQCIKSMQMRCLSQKNSENQIVVIAIKLHLPSEYSVTRGDEYAYLTQRIGLLDRLYSFNSRIDGVIVESSHSEFMIFTTRKVMEIETNNYKNIHLLDMIQEAAFVKVSVGIGYGETANASKYKAFQGIRLAENYKESVVFVVFKNGEVMGPLMGPASGRDSKSIDEKFYKISEETDMSVNTVYNVFSMVKKMGKAEYTSKELANICGTSVRTMDRILQKFCDAGYCEVVGEQLMSQYGRPSRILKFKEVVFI